MTDERDLTLARLVENSVPERVTIGCVVYRIVLVSGSVADSDGYAGRMERNAQIIWIRDDIRPGFAADVLTHEILHACYAHFGISEKRDEEYTVNAISACLCTVLAANPPVTRWISWALGALPNSHSY